MRESDDERSRSGAARPVPTEDLYSRPLLPGLYPPLGYAPDGTPVFRPGPVHPPAGDYAAPASAAAPNPDHRPESGQTPDEPGDPPDGPEPTPGGERRSPGAALIGLAVIIVLVIGVFLGVSELRSSQQQAQQPEVPDIPGLTVLPPTQPVPPPGAEPPFGPPRDEEAAPGSGRIDPAGKQVTYEVTVDGTATVLYVDDDGIQTLVGAPPTWTLDFVGTDMPLRLLVIAGGRGAATCQITVDGQMVVSDEITDTTTRRTASCVV